MDKEGLEEFCGLEDLSSISKCLYIDINDGYVLNVYKSLSQFFDFPEYFDLM